MKDLFKMRLIVRDGNKIVQHKLNHTDKVWSSLAQTAI